MTKKELLLKLAQQVASEDYFLHADKEHCLEIAEGLLENFTRYGYLCCPCRLSSEDINKDGDIICPCSYHKLDIEKFGACFCNLFVSIEHKDDPDFFPEVEDAREFR